jgi:putative ABC transport system permease protein
MIAIAFQMLAHKRSRLILTSMGVGVAFFLAAAQGGLLVGWIHTCTAIVRHSGADVWVMAEQTPAFDYGTAIARQKVYQLRSVPGIEWAEGLFMAWNVWQRPDGRRINVELVGLDRRGAGGPWKTAAGRVADLQHRRDAVMVDELYRGELGVTRAEETTEILGRRARVIGISSGVRTFTAAPFVFTSLKNALGYDLRYGPDEVTYAIGKCAPGETPEAVRDRARRLIRHVEVLTTRELAWRTARYWMVETGVGITVVLTALLGLVVGVVITSQTLYAIVQEHVSEFATLMALGFSRQKLAGIVLVQALLLALVGTVVGSALFFLASLFSSRTPIPLELTPGVYSGLAILTLVSCCASALLAVRTVWWIDPVLVFK